MADPISERSFTFLLLFISSLRLRLYRCRIINEDWSEVYVRNMLNPSVNWNSYQAIAIIIYTGAVCHWGRNYVVEFWTGRLRMLA